MIELTLNYNRTDETWDGFTPGQGKPLSLCDEGILEYLLESRMPVPCEKSPLRIKLTPREESGWTVEESGDNIFASYYLVTPQEEQIRIDYSTYLALAYWLEYEQAEYFDAELDYQTANPEVLIGMESGAPAFSRKWVDLCEIAEHLRKGWRLQGSRYTEYKYIFSEERQVYLTVRR